MTCYHPIPARQGAAGEKVDLWPQLGTENLMIPCGTCLGCKSTHANAWAHRCEHEASMYTDNIFLTLTYDDDNLPDGGHLCPRHLQLFIKRLRQTAARAKPTIKHDPTHPIRYFACGEYGDQFGRPHYHSIIFGLTFTDAYKVGARHGHILYASPTLSALWPHGDSKFGTATTAAANYIAQYTLKKQRRRRYDYENEEGYADINGEWHPKPDPFSRMSTHPAIGTEWLKKFQTDLSQGYLHNNGRKFKIPRAYLKKLRDINPFLLEEIQHRAWLHNKNRTPQNLAAAEAIHKRYKQLTETHTL